MKTKLSIFATAMAFAAACVWADDKPAAGEKKHEAMKPYKGSAEFERIKTLAGKWRGKMDKMKMEVEYTVIAGGSAVMERAFPGTEMEMVTLYHDKDGRLVLTHYCMLHNRPHLVLTGSDDRSISLKLAEGGEVDAKKESHMHALVLTFVSEDEIEQRWTHMADGKAHEPHTMKFQRVKKKGKKGARKGAGTS